MTNKKQIDLNTQYYHGYKFRIYPTKEQAEFIDRCIDIARYVYNWALEQQETQYQLYLDGKIDRKNSFLNAYVLDHLYVLHRKEHPWLLDYPLGFARYAIENAVTAYLRYFSKRCKHPKFKSKKTAKLNYHPRSERMRISGNMLRIEGLGRKAENLIKITDAITDYKFDNSKFVEPTVSKDKFGKYYISFSVIEDKPLSYFEDNNIPESKPLGIDLNLRRDARIVCSDGTRFVSPDISKHEFKLKKLSRKVTKDVRRRKELERANPDKIIEPSKRSEKRRIKLNKAYAKIRNINNTFYDMSIKKIIDKHPKTIIMEDLHVNENIKSKPWTAKYIQFNPLYIIREKMQKKCNMYNIPFILAPREYPSTQMCSNCGHMRKMYTDTVYICHNCGMRMDRDDNAALNLERLAYNYDFTNMSNINLANIS